MKDETQDVGKGRMERMLPSGLPNSRINESMREIPDRNHCREMQQVKRNKEKMVEHGVWALICIFHELTMRGATKSIWFCDTLKMCFAVGSLGHVLF